MAEDFKVKLSVELDTSAAEGKMNAFKSQITSLGKTSPIKLTIDTSNINSQISNIRRQIQQLSNMRVNFNMNGAMGKQAGANIASNITNEVNNAVKAISNTGASAIQNMQRTLKTMKFDSGSIGTITQDLQKMNLEIQNVTTRMSGNNLQMNIKGVDSLGRTVNILKQFNSETGRISTTSKTISQSFNTSADQAKQRANEIKEAYKQLTSISKQYNQGQIKLNGLDKSSQQAKALINTLKQLSAEYKNVYASVKGELSSGQLQGLANIRNNAKNSIALANATSFDKLSSNFNGSHSTNLERISAELDKIRTKSAEVKTAMQEFTTASSNMYSASKSGNLKQMISSYDQYINALNKVNAKIKENQQIEKSAIQNQKLSHDKNTLSLQMDNWLKNNSAVSAEFQNRIRELQAQIQSCDSVSLGHLRSEFKNVQLEAKLLGQTSTSLKDKLLGSGLKQLGMYFSGYAMFTQGIRAVKSMYEEVHKVDTAMTELYRITDLSSSQYNKLYDNMANSAKQYGSTLSDIINSTASWVRLGFNTSDATGLAEITSMYQHVTDLDESTAVNNLVTAYKGFEKQLLETTGGDKTAAIEKISDIYDKLGA